MNSLLINATRAFEALKSLLALVGVTALATYLVLPLNVPLPGTPAFAPAVEAANAAEGASVPAAVVETPLEREQRAVAEFIGKRYRIAADAAEQFVGVAYRAAELHRLDALLILAVMAIESRYNPVAESVVGAKGLMQVIAKYHPEKLADHGGELALLDPEVNILVGAQILREYYRRFGDLETTLQMYVGAMDNPTSQYATKVLAEKARLDAVRFKARKSGQSA